MAPSMAANINPQGAALAAGRAVPLAFLIAAVGVLLVAYTFVRLCQYYRHSGSVYAFVGATLGPRSGRDRGLGAGRHLRVLRGGDRGGGGHLRRAAARLARHLEEPAGLGADPVRRHRARARAGARRAARARRHQRAADRGGVHGRADPHRHRGRVRPAAEGRRARRVRTSPGACSARSRGSARPALFLGVVFGFLSFAGFEASSTLGEETHNPQRDIPRAILGVAIFGGIYFVVVTAAEMMGFGTSAKGVAAFTSSPSLLGDLGTLLRRLVGRQRDHGGDDGVGVRLLPGLHGRRGAAVLRDVAGHVRRRARREQRRPGGARPPTRRGLSRSARP